jgi:hypothetical protein
VTLKWYAGSWAHFYDIYFGTSPTPPRIVAGKHLGPSTALIDYKSYSIAGLAAHTTYYWMIVSKTAAGMKASGPVRSFTTGS